MKTAGSQKCSVLNLKYGPPQFPDLLQMYGSIKVRRYWLFSCRLIPLFSFPAIFNSGHWGAPTQNPAPMILFSFKENDLIFFERK